MMALMNSMSMSGSQNRPVFHATQSVFYQSFGSVFHVTQSVFYHSIGSVFEVTQLVFYQSFGSVFEVTHLVFYFWHSGQIAIYIGKYKMHIL